MFEVLCTDAEESNEMNEGTKVIVQHLARGENRKAEEAFKTVMDQKIGNAMRAKTPEVAQSMFNNEKSESNETYHRCKSYHRSED